MLSPCSQVISLSRSEPACTPCKWQTVFLAFFFFFSFWLFRVCILTPGAQAPKKQPQQSEPQGRRELIQLYLQRVRAGLARGFFRWGPSGSLTWELVRNAKSPLPTPDSRNLKLPVEPTGSSLKNSEAQALEPPTLENQQDWGLIRAKNEHDTAIPWSTGRESRGLGQSVIKHVCWFKNNHGEKRFQKKKRKRDSSWQTSITKQLLLVLFASWQRVSTHF